MNLHDFLFIFSYLSATCRIDNPQGDISTLSGNFARALCGLALSRLSGLSLFHLKSFAAIINRNDIGQRTSLIEGYIKMGKRQVFSRIFSVLLFSLAASAASYADGLAAIKAAGVLKVATSLSVTPYTYTNGEMQPDGSDVATAKQLAKDLGVELKIVGVPVASRIPMLQTGKADLVISVLSMSPERAKVIDFSRPYSLIREVIIAPRNVAVKGYGDLVGKAVGVTRGTVEDKLVTENAKGAEIKRYEDVATLITAAVSGQVQYVATGLVSLDELNKKTGNRFESKFVMKDFMLAIGLRKGNPELDKWVDQWVQTNLENGRLNKIFRHYHHVDLSPEVMNWKK
ncbi:transporter substrate-binding domain-containing protein [Paralcaligenes ginsengisoli]